MKPYSLEIWSSFNCETLIFFFFGDELVAYLWGQIDGKDLKIVVCDVEGHEVYIYGQGKKNLVP